MGTAILCQKGLSRYLYFLTSGHSDAQPWASDAQPWASECPDVKNYKWRLNPLWHRMLYSCTHMATVGIKRWRVHKTELNYNTVECTCGKYGIAQDDLKMIGKGFYRKW